MESVHLQNGYGISKLRKKLIKNFKNLKIIINLTKLDSKGLIMKL